MEGFRKRGNNSVRVKRRKVRVTGSDQLALDISYQVLILDLVIYLT